MTEKIRVSVGTEAESENLLMDLINEIVSVNGLEPDLYSMSGKLNIVLEYNKTEAFADSDAGFCLEVVNLTLEKGN